MEWAEKVTQQKETNKQTNKIHASLLADLFLHFLSLKFSSPPLCTFFPVVYKHSGDISAISNQSRSYLHCSMCMFIADHNSIKHESLNTNQKVLG